MRENLKTRHATLIPSLGENGILDLRMSALSIPTIAYVLKTLSSNRKKSIIRGLTAIVKVLPSLPEHITNMLESPMSDIEDALQAQSAKEGGCDLIVTRNLRDIKSADLPTISPDALLERVVIG